MSDVQNTPNASPEAEATIASLKKRADLLGISYKSNTSIATLQKAINDKLNESVGGEDKNTAESNSPEAVATKASITEDAYKKAMKLHRVIITPMESNKAANHERELFCAGNTLVGTVKRVVEFGEPWHVEHILLNSIKEKKYQMFVSKKNAQGVSVTSAKLVPAYSIAYLDPLTPEELEELADQQIRTRSLADE